MSVDPERELRDRIANGFSPRAAELSERRVHARLASRGPAKRGLVVGRLLPMVAVAAAAVLIALAGYANLRPGTGHAGIDSLTPRVSIGGAAGAHGVASVVAALHSSLSGPISASATSAVVVEKGSRFAPSVVKIRVGGTVTFENLDTVTHRVVIGTTDLGSQRPGQNVEWTAASPGDIAFKFAPVH